MKHNWVLQYDAGEYDYTYKCSHCKKLFHMSGDSSKPFPPDDCPVTVERISDAIKVRQSVIAKAQGEIADLRSMCPHPRLTKKHGSNTGNWCRQDDSYWTEFDCPDCGRRWQEDGSL